MFSWTALLERIDSAWRERPWCAGHLLPKPRHSSHSEHAHVVQARADRQQRENWGSISSLVLYVLLWCLSGARLTNHSDTVFTRQVIVWVVWFLTFCLLKFIAKSLTGTAGIVVMWYDCFVLKLKQGKSTCQKQDVCACRVSYSAGAQSQPCTSCPRLHAGLASSCGPV